MAETGSEIIPPIFYSQKNKFRVWKLSSRKLSHLFFASNKIILDSCGNYPIHFLRAQLVFLTKHDRTGSYPSYLSAQSEFLASTTSTPGHHEVQPVPTRAPFVYTQLLCWLKWVCFCTAWPACLLLKRLPSAPWCSSSALRAASTVLTWRPIGTRPLAM